ncbi:uncharacterized protein AKAW2_60754A [Aspergillus luchuensis]|uniref:Uncharacterized protein n=1 Tax=Aspergillus kawachii TaxID=1069201 RepID=A0A7R7WGY3_ASPKA|nr:uncharacterized protein AKAW2_60754A [Aspergillus luchuensis]BCS02490.1 hypothetical protein AKAW2_60754A [Aspergillus luchuensis]
MMVMVVVEYVATARYQFDQHASIIEYGFSNDIWKAAKPYLKDSMKKNQISVSSLSSWGMAHGDDYWMWQCSSFGGHYSGYGCYADPRENYLRLSSLREAKASLLC